MTKKVEFDYKGGKYTQKIAIRGVNLPWRYQCTDDWIKIGTGATSLSFEVEPTYDFRKRIGNIDIYDKFDNKLTIQVVQTGYMDIRIECPNSIVVYDSYYDTNEYFNAYLTVYGGNRQEPSCNALKPYTSKVWDNSDVYNDFIIRIPKELKGTYTIEHMEARQFRKYCKDNGIQYDNTKLKKTVTITQLDIDDVIGKLIINVDGVQYKSGDEIILDINEKEYKKIKIVSTKFVRLKSNTEYEIVDNKNVEIMKMAHWIECANEPGFIKIKAIEPNYLSTRCGTIRITNSDNPKQFIDITIKQSSIN